MSVWNMRWKEEYVGYIIFRKKEKNGSSANGDGNSHADSDGDEVVHISSSSDENDGRDDDSGSEENKKKKKVHPFLYRIDCYRTPCFLFVLLFHLFVVI